jgi:hypothetical protein
MHLNIQFTPITRPYPISPDCIIPSCNEGQKCFSFIPSITNFALKGLLGKYIIYIVISLCALNAAAQNHYDKIAEKFLLFYNAETPDSIFLLYSPTLKEKLPIEKTRAVFSGLHVQFGELRSLDLLKQDSGFNMYKASFSHQTLSLLLALTDDHLIEGFRLVPYNPDQFPDEKNKKK